MNNQQISDHSANTIPVPNTNLTIIDWKWFNSTSLVGIVLGFDNVTKQTQAYIGSPPPSYNEVTDVIYIAQFGAKLPKQIAEATFSPLPDYKIC